MQLSEKFRRGVVVPADDDAATAFENGDVADDVQVRFVEISGQAEFEKIWKTGFFSELNAQTGCLIDDYEEECVPADKVQVVSTTALEFDKRGAGGSVGRRFFREVTALSKFAQENGRPMYFVL